MSSLSENSRWPPPCKDCNKSLICSGYEGRICTANDYSHFIDVKLLLKRTIEMSNLELKDNEINSTIQINSNSFKQNKKFKFISSEV